MARKMKPSGVEWIGDIPEGWRMVPLARLVSCNDEVLSEDTRGDFLFDYIDIGSVKYGKGIVSAERIRFSESPSRARRVVRKNDVIVSTVRTYLKSVASIPESDVPLVASTGFAVLRANAIDPTFLKYVVLSESFVGEVESRSVGISYPAINASELMRIKVPIPTSDEQSRIGNELEGLCAEIDSAIDSAKQSIDDYKALKKSLIEGAVFGGLNQSGLREVADEWCLPIPRHWGYKQIRYLFELRDERNVKPLSEVNLISLYTDKGVVQHCDLEKTTGNKASTADGYKLVYEGDVVVNIILCWMGAVGRSAYNGVTSPAYDVYRTKDDTVVQSRYYHYLFRTGRFNGKCYQEGRGIMMMRWRTYSSEFKAIKVPVPPYVEQCAIADYLDEKCAAIDALIAEKEALIADLEAYRKSLIFEVVTGKREVA